MACFNCKNYILEEYACKFECANCKYTLLEKDEEPCASCTTEECLYSKFEADGI